MLSLSFPSNFLGAGTTTSNYLKASSGSQYVSKATFWFILSGILSHCVSVSAEEECLFSRIWCYDCDTYTDHKCKDPFNATAYPHELPTLKRCEGCCVKIVMNRGTPGEVVRRTCTSNLQINLFLVDHVCMFESEDKGLMCFCESDACNSTPRCYASVFILKCALLYVAGVFLFAR